MKQVYSIENNQYEWSLDRYFSIAIPFTVQENQVNAWYVPPIKKEPFKMGDYVGSIEAGSSVNFFNLTINPHGNGTHTECLGHISEKHESIKDVKIDPFILAEIVTINPIRQGEDLVITKDLLENKIACKEVKALIIRTIPNESDKLTFQYTGTNPAYLSEEAALFLHDLKIDHLLIDLPSVDKENDEGKLLSHKAFWGFHDKKRHQATITEMIYVDSSIQDGLFLLNLQLLPIENDASPSNPLIFPLLKLS